MIQLELLEKLVAFADCGTLSAASEKLHISQPSLTRSMRQIEEYYDIPLFEHQKNKLTLNEDGLYLVSLARTLLTQARQLDGDLLRAYQSRHKIAIGSVTLSPLWRLVPLCTSLYEGRMTSAEIDGPESLLTGLKNDLYQLIVLADTQITPEVLAEENLLSVSLYEEFLYVCLPKVHPLASRSSLSAADLDGETFLEATQLGFWSHVHTTLFPHSTFLPQKDRSGYKALIEASSLPCFFSNISLAGETIPESRVVIPLEDEGAHATFLCIFKKEKRKEFRELIQTLTAG